MLDTIILITLIVVLTALVLYLDARRDRWLTISRDLLSHLAQSDMELRSKKAELELVYEANLSLSQGLEQWRTYASDLEALVPTSPTVSPEAAITNMKHCLTCDRLFHANHFVVNRKHVALFANV